MMVGVGSFQIKGMGAALVTGGRLSCGSVRSATEVGDGSAGETPPGQPAGCRRYL